MKISGDLLSLTIINNSSKYKFDGLAGVDFICEFADSELKLLMMESFRIECGLSVGEEGSYEYLLNNRSGVFVFEHISGYTFSIKGEIQPKSKVDFQNGKALLIILGEKIENNELDK